MELTYLHAVLLGIVEGLTEFLPVSSTGHLTITEKLLGLQVDDPAVTAYTAIIQLGAIAATLLYFAKDILRLLAAWVGGLRSALRAARTTTTGWPGRSSSARSPWRSSACWPRTSSPAPCAACGWWPAALILWSVVMWAAERRHDVLERRRMQRGEGGVTLRDGLVIGLVQCFSLIPGISRSGATISAGLFAGLDRVTATRLSFFMAIPALTAAGLYELKDVDVGGARHRPDARRHRRRLRGGLRLDRVAAAVRRGPPHHGVRLVPRGPRRAAHRGPLRRLAHRGLTPVGALTHTGYGARAPAGSPPPEGNLLCRPVSWSPEPPGSSAPTCARPSSRPGTPSAR